MPTLQLPDNFLPRATQLLLPRLSTADEREAWLAQAFFLNEPRLYHDLRQLTGSPIVYVTRCITALLTARCVPGRDVHALALLLNAVRIASAPVEQQEIDSLVTMLDPICGPDANPGPDGGTTATDTATLPVVKPAKPLQTIDTPEAERTPTVFISYSHRDDDFASRLIGDLQNAGHAIWIDTVSIKGGDAWVRSIADGIRNSYAFVTIVSPDANGSRWVLREYLLAENLRKPIYPVLARSADIPFQMIDRQVVEFHIDYDAGLRELLETLPPPTIPVPSVEDIMDVLPAPAAPPAPAESLPEPPRQAPPAAPASRGSGAGLNLPDLGEFFGALKDAVLGRRREQQDDESTKKAEAPSRPPAFPQAPVPSPKAEPVYGADDLDADEVMAEMDGTGGTNRRALELQYVQRQWAEAFSAQQDAPETDDDMIVRWMALPADSDLNGDASGAESGHVDNVGPGLLSMGRAVVMGDSPHETSEAIWSALNALMTGALNDPTKPLPVIINLAQWTDDTQPIEAFIQAQLGELSGYWYGLLAQKRAALLFTGFEALHSDMRDSRTDAVETFLRAHPELPVLIAMVG
jgi:hypothetical protein